MNTKRIVGVFVLLLGTGTLSTHALGETMEMVPDEEEFSKDTSNPPEVNTPPEVVTPPETMNPEPAPQADTTAAPAAGDDGGGGCQVGNSHNDALPMVVLLLALGYLAWRPRSPQNAPYGADIRRSH